MDEQTQLVRIIKDIAEGNYSNDIMPFTKPGVDLHIREIAEAIAMMMVKLEARELRLEQVNTELVDNTLKTVASIANALTARDEYTRGHGNRVAGYAMRLGQKIGLETERLKEIEIAGLLHDIGKIGFTDKVFNNIDINPDPDILAEIRQHPDTGFNILKDLDFLGPVLEYIHSHHEHLNGKGYPRGLSGEEIPIGARIISIADCFDAITTDRAYQKGKSSEEGFQILGRLAKAQLDPDLVPIFIREIQENGMEIT